LAACLRIACAMRVNGDRGTIRQCVHWKLATAGTHKQTMSNASAVRGHMHAHFVRTAWAHSRNIAPMDIESWGPPTPTAEHCPKRKDSFGHLKLAPENTKLSKHEKQKQELRATSRLSPWRAPLSGWCMPAASGTTSPRGAGARRFHGLVARASKY